jgi:hypothetical protein
MEVDKILAKVDSNGSGEIDYSGIIKFLLNLFRMGRGHHKQIKVAIKGETEGCFPTF